MKTSFRASIILEIPDIDNSNPRYKHYYSQDEITKLLTADNLDFVEHTYNLFSGGEPIIYLRLKKGVTPDAGLSRGDPYPKVPQGTAVSVTEVKQPAGNTQLADTEKL